MKKLNLNLQRKGYNKHKSHSFKTNKNNILGTSNYVLNIFVNGKYSMNRYLKFNVNISNSCVHSILKNK